MTSTAVVGSILDWSNSERNDSLLALDGTSFAEGPVRFNA